MSAGEPKPKVAYMEDADGEGNVIEDTKTYAASTYAASTAPSPVREKPNTSRTRRDSSRRNSSSPGQGLTDSDSTIHPSSAVRRDSKMKSREKERERPSTSRKTVTVARPSVKPPKPTPAQTNSYRRQSDDSVYYGVSPITTTASSRPRSQTARPASYYGSSGSSRPPLSNQRYYTQPAPGALPTSFPPQAWANAGAVPYPVAPSYPPPQQDYFAAHPQHQQLRARFERPQSAMGHRTVQSLAFGDDYEQENDRSLIRRNSQTRKAREEVDRMRMPPPARPASARPVFAQSPFTPPPPPPPATTRRVGFENDDFDGDGSLFQDVSPLAPYDYGTHAAVPVHRNRRPSVSNRSSYYDAGAYQTEVAGRSSRRNSYYGEQSVSSASAFEEKLRSAATYQDEVNGGPTVPLTAETLKKAGRNRVPSSRSTQSSSRSRDESDYRHSNTTRTTRSSADEDITIRVKGQATLKVGGAEMQCNDAEININSRPLSGTVRSGSDHDSSYYLDERRQPRIERPPTRVRSNSQAGSYARVSPLHDPYSYGLPIRSATPAAHAGFF